jgi:hypothetical protein
MEEDDIFFHVFLTPALDGVSGQLHGLADITPLPIRYKL